MIRQAKSNTMDISSGVAEAVERINERFTELQVMVTDDQAVFIRNSVKEVLITLLYSMITMFEIRHNNVMRKR